jgi:membrane-associated protease RseP (regulator of RpoE activity)
LKAAEAAKHREWSVSKRIVLLAIPLAFFFTVGFHIVLVVTDQIVATARARRIRGQTSPPSLAPPNPGAQNRADDQAKEAGSALAAIHERRPKIPRDPHFSVDEPRPSGSRESPPVSEESAPRILSALGPPTRDPRELLARAERLASAGFDITIVRTKLGSRTLDLPFPASSPQRAEPIRYGGGIAGLRMEGFSPNSLPIMAGLENGDVITSVNGFPITSPDRIASSYEGARASGMAVIEVLRGPRRIVVAVTWPSGPTSAITRARAL